MTHLSEKDSSLDLLIILSLGRSGSTFLAKAISESSDYQNGGENRYFWSELAKKSSETHPIEIRRFFKKKFSDGDKILDKTPELYRHLDNINFGSHRVRWIELKRSPEAIETSRANFISILRQPKRWIMRIRKYRREYGLRWYIPVLQRWYFLGAIFGWKSSGAFSTNSNFSDAILERKEFDLVLAKLRESVQVITIDYEAFNHSVESLEEIGFSKEQINRVRGYFRR